MHFLFVMPSCAMCWNTFYKSLSYGYWNFPIANLQNKMTTHIRRHSMSLSFVPLLIVHSTQFAACVMHFVNVADRNDMAHAICALCIVCTHKHTQPWLFRIFTPVGIFLSLARSVVSRLRSRWLPRLASDGQSPRRIRHIVWELVSFGSTFFHTSLVHRCIGAIHCRLMHATAYSLCFYSFIYKHPFK